VSGRPVVLPAAEATAIGVVLEIIEAWLRGAPEQVTAGLARSAYGEHSDRAMTWVSLLLGDLRYHRDTLAGALRSDNRLEQW
jgi:hypothetical protein